MLRGTFVAMVTPFTADDKLNEKELERMIEFQIANGTTGIVPVGTTGESPVLSWEEHNRVIELTCSVVNKRVKVIAGTGSNNTREAIAATQHAERSGADMALVVVPYYNKPTQEGMYRHFAEVAKNTSIEIMLYNIPGRCGVNMLPETVERLTEFKNITAIKEASGDLNQASDVILRTKGKMNVLSGDDTLTLPMLAVGGTGVVSVLANIVPDKLKNLVVAFDKGDINTATKIHEDLFKIGRAMFIETNPSPIKEAMNMIGKFNVGHARLPLTALLEGNRGKLKNVLKEFGLL